MVSNEILRKRKEYFDLKFTETKDNPKQFWKNINHLIYNKQHNEPNEIELKDENGKIINIADATNIFNRYYISIPRTTLEKQYGNLSEIELIDTLTHTVPDSIFFYPVDEFELNGVITNLKNTYSTGVLHICIN